MNTFSYHMWKSPLARIEWLFILCLLFGTFAFGQNPQTQTAPIYAVNAKYTNGVAPGYAPTAGTGLNLNVGPGTVNCAATMDNYAGGTLTLAANTTNYVYLDSGASCGPAVKTTAFTAIDIPIATVVTGASVISSIVDDRTFFNVALSSLAGAILTAPSSGQSISWNTNGLNSLTIDNPNAGSGAGSGLILTNGTGNFEFAIAGTGAVNPGASEVVSTTSGAGLAFLTNNGNISFSTVPSSTSLTLDASLDAIWGTGVGIYTQGVTGGNKGAGTINAAGLYMNGSGVATLSGTQTFGGNYTFSNNVALSQGADFAGPGSFVNENFWTWQGTTTEVHDKSTFDYYQALGTATSSANFGSMFGPGLQASYWTGSVPDTGIAAPEVTCASGNNPLCTYSFHWTADANVPPGGGTATFAMSLPTTTISNLTVTGSCTGCGGGGSGSVGTTGQAQIVGATAGSFAAGAWTDNGSTVASTEPISAPSFIGSGAGGVASALTLLQGTAPGTIANAINIIAPTSVTAYNRTLPGAAPSTNGMIETWTTSGVASFTNPLVTLASNTFTNKQIIAMGSLAQGIDITSNNANGPAIVLDATGSSGNSDEFFTNSHKNFGIFSNTNGSDMFICTDSGSGIANTCGGYHVASFGGTPGIVSGTGACSTTTCASFPNATSANDNSMLIEVVTSATTPAASATIFTVNFAKQWFRTTASGTSATAYLPSCTAFPASATASALTGVNQVQIPGASSTAFSMMSGPTALAASTTYYWQVHCL